MLHGPLKQRQIPQFTQEQELNKKVTEAHIYEYALAVRRLIRVENLKSKNDKIKIQTIQKLEAIHHNTTLVEYLLWANKIHGF